MKKSEKYLKIFNEKLQKYSTNEVAKIFANFDRFYYQNYKDEPITKKFYCDNEIIELIVQPWLFSHIVFYSTHFNDNNYAITERDAWELYLDFYKYSTEKGNEFADENFVDQTKNILVPILYGHMQEQSLYQVSLLLFQNRFNRNYYLLKNKFFGSIDINTILTEKYNTDLDTYIHILCTIALISVSFIKLNDDIVLKNMQILKFIGNQDLYLKIIHDMSVSYDECKLANEEIFKISPILRTESFEYIVPSIYTMFYNIGDKLYWLLKDEFKGKNTFVTEFGGVFENYIFDILIKQYGKSFVERIPRVEGEKSADFIIKGMNYNFIIEVKSGVARANAKLENLNIESLEFYIKNNVIDAMKQLDATVKRIGDNKNNICIILNYDLVFVEDALLHDISTEYCPFNYKIDNLLLFGIDYFEIFINKYNSLNRLEELFDSYKGQELKTYKMIENCEISKNYFFDDVFSKELSKLTKA